MPEALTDREQIIARGRVIFDRKTPMKLAQLNVQINIESGFQRAGL